MGSPTTTTGPTNVYYLIDDYGTTAGQTGAATGGTSGNPVTAEFTATSIANAVQMAHIISSGLQRPVRLVNKYGGSPPWTLVTGVAATLAITSCPSGAGY